MCQKTPRSTYHVLTPLRAKVPRSVAYDYYTPDSRGVEAPVEMVVE